MVFEASGRTAETQLGVLVVREPMVDDTTSETDSSGLVRATYDQDSSESLSVTIVEAVARAKGVPSEDLEIRLFESLDSDALDRLFTPTDPTIHEAEVSFVVAEHAVVVRNTGDVFVRPLE